MTSHILKAAQKRLDDLVMRQFRDRGHEDSRERGRCLTQVMRVACTWNRLKACEELASHVVDKHLLLAGRVLDEGGSTSDIKYHGREAVREIEKVYRSRGSKPKRRTEIVLKQSRAIFFLTEDRP